MQFFGCKIHPLHTALGGKSKTPAKKNKVGMPEKSSKQIVAEIFGPDGLTSLDTSVSFAQKASEIERRFGEKVGSYLTEKLIPTIRKHVFEISKTDN